ncbi:MAG: hypothetical protein CAF45_016545 [Nitrospira sp. CG24E]|nr:MAG: hypothetical protein CAF45_016545 [Nitrospira sp. CG24E]
MELSGGQFVNFERPSGFEVKVSRDPDDEFRPTLKFSHVATSGIKDFGFKVSIHTSEREKLRDESFAIELMSDLCGRLEAGAVEGTVPIRKIKETDVWYCYATDAKLQNESALPPGSYRHITVAFSRHEGYGFTAIAYSQSINDSLFRDFLDTMSTLRARESTPNRH